MTGGPTPTRRVLATLSLAGAGVVLAACNSSTTPVSSASVSSSSSPSPTPSPADPLRTTLVRFTNPTVGYQVLAPNGRPWQCAEADDKTVQVLCASGDVSVPQTIYVQVRSWCHGSNDRHWAEATQRVSGAYSVRTAAEFRYAATQDGVHDIARGLANKGRAASVEIRYPAAMKAGPWATEVLDSLAFTGEGSCVSGT